MDQSLAFELWLDKAHLHFGPESKLTFGEQDPGLFVADSMLFFNKTPKEDTFTGELDATLTLRLVFSGQEVIFDYIQNPLAVRGKVVQPKCMGGKVSQANLMMDFIDSIDKDEKPAFSGHPIEGRYRIQEGALRLSELLQKIQTLQDFSQFNPTFLERELSRIIRDKRFWMRPKLSFTGKFPKNVYLPVASQLNR